MTLVEVRKRAFYAQAGVVLGAEIAVEIRGGVKPFAVRVIAEKREIVAEALLDLDDPSFVQRRCLRTVLIGLENPRIHEALKNLGARAGRGMGWVEKHYRIKQRIRIPIAIGHRLSVRQRFRHELEGLWHGVDIDSHREPQRMRVNTAQRDGKTVGNFTLDTKRRLLGVGVLVARLAAEDDRQQRQRSRIGYRDSELREISGRNASHFSCRRSFARDFALREECLENASR